MGSNIMHTRKTILLVEDDALTRGQLRILLHDGYDVLTARDGVEASELGTILAELFRRRALQRESAP